MNERTLLLSSYTTWHLMFQESVNSYNCGSGQISTWQGHVFMVGIFSKVVIVIITTVVCGSTELICYKIWYKNTFVEQSRQRFMFFAYLSLSYTAIKTFMHS